MSTTTALIYPGPSASVVIAGIVCHRGQPADVPDHLVDQLQRRGWLPVDDVGSHEDARLVHIGGGHYELPNGERVRGKEAAIAALADLDPESNNEGEAS